jgi:crotonobetainyl-CoA:carnitine CoA-transferase CaiB-like acyl-CoA transferase
MIADLRDPEYAEAIVAVKGVVPGRGTSHGSAKDSVSKLSDVRERMQHVEAVWQAFLRTHTKQELFVGAQTRGVVLMPVNTVKDIIEDIGLQERNYFVHVLHPELGQSLKYPGPPYRLSETPWRIVRRAPLIREH